MEKLNQVNPDFCSIDYAPNKGGIDLNQFKGLSERQIEQIYSDNNIPLPDEWLDPSFRDSITRSDSAGIEANLCNGELGYYDTLGTDARTIYYERNIAGQGFPGEYKK